MTDRVMCPGCGVDHFPNLAWKHVGCVANTQPEVANAEAAPVANKSRHGKYADPDRRREYMRDLMRKRRAKSQEA